jgi:hypothetical protein
MPRFVQRIAFRAEAAPVLTAAKPLAIIDAVESVDGGVRLHGRALNTDSVAVRLEDGWPVRVTMPIVTAGVATDWTLDWPGLNARQAFFTVHALPHLDEKGERPLARRWISAHDHWTPQRRGGR